MARRNVLVTTPNCTQNFGEVPVEFSHMLDVDHRQFFTEASLRGLLDERLRQLVVEQTAPIDRNLAGSCSRGRCGRSTAGSTRRPREAALLLPPARRARPPVTRVLFVSAEPVGTAMAGPADPGGGAGARARRAVRRHRRRPGPSDTGVAPVELLEAGLADFDALLEAPRSTTWSWRSGCPAAAALRRALPVRFVADLYNPQMIEVLEAAADGGGSSPRRAWRSMLGQCAVADLVICASEKQRDLWLGGMGLTGLIDPDRYRRDPTFRSFVDVVPFGLPDEPPRRASRVLKGVWPGIGADDRVLLWAGGVWRWLDAITPIKARRAAARRRPARAPGLPRARAARARPGRVPDAAPTRRIAFAPERGLEGECVHFNPGWVPYAERAAYLLEADLGVCAHHDHLEARFSFRTRVLDHFWAGLPSVVSSGDAIGELVDRRGLGQRGGARGRRGLRPPARSCSTTPRRTPPPRGACASSRRRCAGPSGATARGLLPRARRAPGARPARAAWRAPPTGSTGRARRPARARRLGRGGQAHAEARDPGAAPSAPESS